ncbi:heterokaryon incompatibility protein-domain-containing protein [Lasiosphaeris hirsuta]|uniref:Heterokaryon incompatibility protein-domain-containing protein n=1 Tax=Lasiosphaeris hirsuta TaxID=260670 RepID=A0AA40DU37_9PEZI|nr:heterokaryon incompatibility protein-domain-containing protein [Lasiosphaeris hirsuta]
MDIISEIFETLRGLLVRMRASLWRTAIRSTPDELPNSPRPSDLPPTGIAAPNQDAVSPDAVADTNPTGALDRGGNASSRPGLASKRPPCLSCGDLDKDNLDSQPGLWDYGGPTPSLRVLETTSSGCLACKAIVNLIKQHAEMYGTSTRQDAKIKIQETNNVMLVGYVVKPDRGKMERVNYEIYWEFSPTATKVTKSLPWPSIKVARSLAADFSAKEASRIISSWMDECQHKHRCLDVYAASKKLPTRLIDVGDGENPPRLCEPSEGDGWKYIALSHCWGKTGQQPLISDRKNFENWKKCIPMERFPPTFADAVELCRALNIRYLWIDSLCIIQNDRDDWEREAATMTTVYQNAWLTISADGAANSSEGLFSRVGTRKYLPVAVDLAKYDTAIGDNLRCYGRVTDLFGFGRRGDSNEDRQVHRVTDSSKKNEPLRQRAWTFQEWALSPRIVHFCNGEILWGCVEKEGCECQLEMVDRLIPEEQQQPRGVLSRVMEDGRIDRDEAALWRLAVTEYTRRQLTKSRDKLVALSGVAQLIKERERGDDIYIAGLWRSHLPLALLWNARPKDGCELLGKDYAPSWSWAAVSCPIDYEHLILWNSNDVEAVCQVLTAFPGTPDIVANPFGPTRGAFLHVKALLSKVSGRKLWLDRATNIAQVVGAGRPHKPDNIGWRATLQVDVPPLRVGRRWSRRSLRSYPDSYENEEILTEFEFLAIGVNSPQSGGDAVTQILGLALEEAESSGKIKRFTRTGVLSLDLGVNGQGAGIPWKDTLREVFRAAEQEVILV